MMSVTEGAVQCEKPMMVELDASDIPLPEQKADDIEATAENEVHEDGEPALSNGEIADNDGADNAEEVPKDLSSDAETVKDADKSADAGANNGNNEKTSEEDEDEAWKKIKDLPKIASVKMMAFNQFKNRHGEDEGRHIIEVFRAGPRSKDEINQLRREEGRRPQPAKTPDKPDPSDTWIQRVRIQSEPILEHIQNVTDTSGWDTTRPWTFFRPFSLFIFFRDKMKSELKSLEDRWGEAERLDVEKLKASEAADSTKGQEHAEDSKDKATNEPETEGITALRHMRCYVEFVDKEIFPLYDRFSGSSQRKVRFSDLWMLFRHGDIVYSSSDKDESKDSDLSSLPKTKSMHQTAWRYYALSFQYLEDGYPDDLGTSSQDFEALCYYIDHDGDSYGAVKHAFKIKFFEGEKDITSLPVYPMRFAKESDKILTRLKEQGHRFQSVIKERHLRYEGWTITRSPIGKTEPEFRSREHIDSEVIIDLVEGFQQYPSCMPDVVTFIPNVDEWELGEDNIEIKHWSDRTRTKLLHTVKEKLVRSDITIDRQFNALLGKTPIIASADTKPITELDEDDLVLLPRRLMAYALRERKFVMVDIWNLQPVIAQINAFRDLKINPQHKRMVRSLVQAHFRRQELEKRHPQIELNQDLIQGKGSGLILLLHGAPGVGKTATAQAVAQVTKRPLFPITCGDLGFTPQDVERALGEITRLAHLWNCVLLLDEADIFLTRRGMDDFKRNALVSVFLRVLEYYSGILFLTTNRVGTLDEAFKSRIHVSLYYETLKRKQSLAIFQINIERLKEIEAKKEEQLKGDDYKEPILKIDEKSIMHYAAWYFDNFPESRWNGRQIRNAFQLASSLAQYDMRKSSLDDWDDNRPNEETSDDAAPGPVLDWNQFAMVADAIDQFDSYLQEATGRTDEDAARIERTRADHFEYQKASPRPRYQPSGSPWERPGQGGRPLASHHDPRSTPSRPSQGRPRFNQNDRRESPSAGRRQGQSRRQYQPPQSTTTPSKNPSRRMDFQASEWDDEAPVDSYDSPMMDKEEYDDPDHSYPHDDFDDDVDY